MHFDIVLSGDAKAVMTASFDRIAQKGGKVIGNPISGSVSLQGIEFDYAVVGNVLTIYITRKPLMATYRDIQFRIKGYFV